MAKLTMEVITNLHRMGASTTTGGDVGDPKVSYLGDTIPNNCNEDDVLEC